MDPIERIRELRQEAADQLARMQGEMAAIQDRLRATKARIDEYDAALKVLQSLDGVSDAEAGQGEADSISSGSFATNVRVLGSDLTAKDAIKSIILEHPKDGLKLANFRSLAHERFGALINRKTISNVLWKLKEEGVAYSEGHSWYAKSNGSPSEEGEPS